MIIESLLDTDLYKFTMQQAVFLNYPDATATYEFTCRNDTDLLPCYDTIVEEIDTLAYLDFYDNQLDYLRSTGYFQERFLAQLQRFSLDPEQVGIYEKAGKLRISVTGPWWETILWEVPILAIVNEAYFSRLSNRTTTTRATVHREGLARLLLKTRVLQLNREIQLMEFGTRRRFSRDWQETVVQTLHENCPGSLIGTSNVSLALKYGLQPMGTMAHEWLQAHQVLAPLADFQRVALEKWLLTYRGKLGIALTDCIGTNAFCKDFDLLLARAYTGVRHDSGDPYLWCNQILDHYKRLNVDARTKEVVFSDGLNIESARQLTKAYGKMTNVICGIGTNLTNDMGLPALPIVMKMTHLNGHPVAKISDEPGKATRHDPIYLQHLANTFGVEL